MLSLFINVSQSIIEKGGETALFPSSSLAFQKALIEHSCDMAGT